MFSGTLFIAFSQEPGFKAAIDMSESKVNAKPSMRVYTYNPSI
jgi:hypothetical protein